MLFVDEVDSVFTRCGELIEEGQAQSQARTEADALTVAMVAEASEAAAQYRNRRSEPVRQIT